MTARRKISQKMIHPAILALLLMNGGLQIQAATTINSADKLACGANFGWLDCRGDTNSGAVIGEYVCSGSIYSANVGWINLGGGSPTNGIQYQNISSNDFGVNLDGLGNLRGLAYGANIGWINFENTGAPKVDLFTGNLGGYAWSANCGWISLSNTIAHLRTDVIVAGADSDHNGLPDAWELQKYGHLGINANDDPDGDGMSNLQEYLADTNPNDANDNLRISNFSRNETFTRLHWTARPTRFYEIQRLPALDAVSSWEGLGVTPVLGFDTENVTDSAELNFYRIRAVRPLAP